MLTSTLPRPEILFQETDVWPELATDLESPPCADLAPAREVAPLPSSQAEPESDLIDVRTAWISDIHLGTPSAQTDRLLEFLRLLRCERLYIVGDLIDGWALKKLWFWPSAHNTVIQKILRLARKGTRITYVPGNHDEFFRDFLGLTFGDIAVRRRAYHRTADGRRFLVLHGDEFDGIIRRYRLISMLGSVAYSALLRMNHPLNWIRRKMGLHYWSLSAHMKGRVKDWVKVLARFEKTVAREAHERGVTGVICGHIHRPDMRQIGDVLYMNTGDWVESCTALVEHHDGHMEILQWPIGHSA